MASRADLTITNGDDYAATVSVLLDDGQTPADLTGYTVLAQIKNNPSDLAADAVMNFATTVNQNTIALGLTHDQTQTLIGSRYVWDLETTDSSGWIATIVYGQVTVRPRQR